jgi:hypothetical protein
MYTHVSMCIHFLVPPLCVCVCVYIYIYIYIFDKCRKNLSHNKLKYNYSKKMFTGRAKPIRIIGVPNNQRPDIWSSTALSITRHVMKTYGQ